MSCPQEAVRLVLTPSAGTLEAVYLALTEDRDDQYSRGPHHRLPQLSLHGIRTWSRRSRWPDQLEVEFGLSFSAKGNVIVVGGEVGATPRVKVTYDAKATG